MFTQEERDLLLQLLGSVNVSGTRQQIKATMEKLDALEKKVQALPVEEPVQPKEEKKSRR
jgi:hypothetical protein